MLRELRTLTAVAREGSFAAAGERIGLTQSAISAQMQRLESSLNIKLFERHGRTARLNRQGQLVLKQAQELIRQYERLGAAPEEADTPILINIGAIASVQRSLLPDAVAAFHQQHTGCRTRIVPGLSLALVNLVDAGELDMAAVIRPPFALHTDLRMTLLVREPFRLIVPRRITGNDWAALLSKHPFIRYDRTSFGGRQVDRFLRRRHLSVNEVCEVDELEAIVKLVANGVGIALAPQTRTLRRWPAAVRAIDLGSQTFHRDIVLVHRTERSLSTTAQALLHEIIAQADMTASSG